MGRFDTRYIGKLDYETRSGRRFDVEIQVEPTEDAGGELLDLRVVRFDNGDPHGTTELTRTAAEKLRDALTAWLDTPVEAAPARPPVEPGRGRKIPPGIEA